MVIEPGLRHMTGVRIGHATHGEERTGCTVIAFDRPALTAAEVRGAAPGTRELDLLAPGRTVQRADAILLTGGSAFGLRAAEGVMRELAAAGRGVPTPAMPVPIVPAAVIYDLGHGAPAIPTADDGAAAWRSARPLPEVESGRVGAGTGARWGSVRGGEELRPGGVGVAQVAIGEGIVTALAVVNAHGMVMPADDPRPHMLHLLVSPPFGQSTTLVAVLTDLPCDHGTLGRLCVAAHDAIARVIWPAHTIADGDVAFACTTREGTIPAERILPLAVAAELAVEAAIGRGAGLTGVD